MDIVNACCAGLDVHKETVVVTVRRRQENGKVQQQTRTFGTMTEQLLELGDWLADKGVTHLAMESTGVYWKPIWNLLEDRFQILLVNAQHIKHVPGAQDGCQGQRVDCPVVAVRLAARQFCPADAAA